MGSSPHHYYLNQLGVTPWVLRTNDSELNHHFLISQKALTDSSVHFFRELILYFSPNVPCQFLDEATLSQARNKHAQGYVFFEKGIKKEVIQPMFPYATCIELPSFVDFVKAKKQCFMTFLTQFEMIL